MKFGNQGKWIHIYRVIDVAGFKVNLGSFGALVSKWPVSRKQAINPKMDNHPNDGQDQPTSGQDQPISGHDLQPISGQDQTTSEQDLQPTSGGGESGL